MTFSYQIAKDDWAAFHRHQHRCARGMRGKPRLWFRVGVMLLAAFVVFLILRDPLGGAAEMVMISLAFVASLHAFPGVWESWLARRFERTMDHPDNVHVFGPSTMTLTPEHIRVQRHGTEATVTWPNVVRADRTDDHIFLYLSTVEALTIARASLENTSFDDVWAQVTECLDRCRDRRDEPGSE